MSNRTRRRQRSIERCPIENTDVSRVLAALARWVMAHHEDADAKSPCCL